METRYRMSTEANRGFLHYYKEETAICNLALFIKCSGADHLLNLGLKLVIDILVETNGKLL